MGRPKKIKPLQIEQKQEVIMSEANVLDSLETEIDLKRQELEKVKNEIEEHKHSMKALPMREIDADEMILVKKQQSRSNESRAFEEKLAKQKQSDNVMVTGKFINRRVPGQPAKLTYLKYEDDPVKWYTLEDGKVYTIPRGFADQINDHYHMPKFIQRTEPMDPSAPQSQIQEVDTSNKKYAFVPIAF